MKAPLLLAAIVAAMAMPSANALILWGGDNDANQTDPGTGAPWGSVAMVTNADGSLISGSAVYLGDGFLLTANHVTMDLTYSFITFDQVEFFAIDPAFNDGVRDYGMQVADGVDLAVFKLTSIPLSATAAVMLDTPTESFSSAATIVGWGVGRDPMIPVETAEVDWGDDSTSAKRWGENVPKFFGTNPYDFLVTIAGGSGPEFSPDGVGADEAALTLYDSGSGLFQQIGGNWYLIGIGTAVENFGSTEFGDDNATGGDANYFARVSSYHDQITALVPEPSTAPLALTAAALLAGWQLLKRRRKSSR